MRSNDETSNGPGGGTPAPGEGRPPAPEYLITPGEYDALVRRDPVRARAAMVLRLHEACSGRIYGFLRKSVAPDVAADLTQETFLKLLQVKNLEMKSISISYLFRVAQNLLRRRYNVMARSRAVLESRYHRELREHAGSQSEDPGSTAVEAGDLEQALEQLCPHEQRTIRLIVCEGRSYSEAARSLNVPVSTVNNWKHRALSKLRGIIDAADDRDPAPRSARGRAAPQGDRARQAPGEIEIAPRHRGVESSRGPRRTPARTVRVAG